MLNGVNQPQFSVINDTDINSMDLETALVFVQMKRAESMETQLRGQLKEVQTRNEKNAKLNEFLQEMIKISNSLKTGAKNEDKIGDQGFEAGKDLTQLAINAGLVMDFFKKQDTSKELAEASIELTKWTQSANNAQANLDHFYANPACYVDGKVGGELTPLAKQSLEIDILPHLAHANAKVSEFTEKISNLKFAAEGAFSKSTTKGEIETAISKIKSQIDANNSTQQLDMLRLQSLSSRRNEVFDLITNFVKKMQDIRNSIISNIR